MILYFFFIILRSISRKESRVVDTVLLTLRFGLVGSCPFSGRPVNIPNIPTTGCVILYIMESRALSSSELAGRAVRIIKCYLISRTAGSGGRATIVSYGTAFSIIIIVRARKHYVYVLMVNTFCKSRRAGLTCAPCLRLFTYVRYYVGTIIIIFFFSLYHPEASSKILIYINVPALLYKS